MTRRTPRSKRAYWKCSFLARPPETLDKKYYRRRLRKFRERAKSKKLNPLLKQETQAYYLPTDRKVCLVVDESGMTGMGLKDFFKQVTVATRIIEMTVIAVSNDGML